MLRLILSMGSLLLLLLLHFTSWLLLAFVVTQAEIEQKCTNEIIKLQPCLSYVQNQVPLPSSSCCMQLGVVRSEAPVCLCELISSLGDSSYLKGVNVSSLYLLPSICKVQADPSQCKGLNSSSNSSSTSNSTSTSTSTSSTRSTSSTAAPSSSAAKAAAGTYFLWIILMFN